MMLGKALCMAITWVLVGLVRPVKMLESDAGEIFRRCANSCCVIFSPSIINLILSRMRVKIFKNGMICLKNSTPALTKAKKRHQIQIVYKDKE